MIKVPPTGPLNADIMIVGEAPGANEEKHRTPFIGASGQELDRMLHEAGIIRTECYITNVCKYRPQQNKIENWFTDKKTESRKKGWPERYGMFYAPQIAEGLKELSQEIAIVKPRVIIVLGNLALWATTGQTGITKYRGSWEMTLPEYGTIYVLPTYHPAAILRKWDWRHIAVHDLKKAKRLSLPVVELPPPREYIIRPTFAKVTTQLQELLRRANAGPIKLAVDIETRATHIACVGIAWSATEAMCIPLMCVEKDEGYWMLEEEVFICHLLRSLLEHPNVGCIGHNFHYDCFYFVLRLAIYPNTIDDTMFKHHVLWPGTQKGLDYITSLYYPHYRYWKEDGKTWNKTMDEDQLWRYNCDDCVSTFYDNEVLDSLITQAGMEEPYKMQMSLFRPVLDMMLRGVKIDVKRRKQMAGELLEAIRHREQFLCDVVGFQCKKTTSKKPWYNSPQQTMDLFYNQMNLPVQYKRSTRKPTVEAEALKALARKQPLIAPLCDTLEELRSLGVFLNTFVNAPIDIDNRLRCQYGPAGTETFRFNSSSNPIGTGTNLQNIPEGN